ncbi:DUF6173 family protein [Primorskyibacter sp. S187A]|uniref:DUF6173 family protein n=1 Tax=Primorskyibacter sp. S187A TaxID=3415130 RepID=UPI003C7E6DAF
MDDRIETSAEIAEAAGLPRRLDAHTEEADTTPAPTAVTDKPVERKSPAEWAYERLILYIQKFEETLDSEHEVAMGFAGGDAGVMRIEGMGYFDPDIITFYGADPTGARTQLVQHVSQLNVLLRALPKTTPEVAPRRIGFALAKRLEEEGKAT